MTFEELYLSGVLFIFGLVVGSFLNVIIYRLPRHESIVWPASHCPHCNSSLRPLDNIPVLSYIFLRGKCRQCGGRISMIYPVVELMVAFSFVALMLNFGFSLVLVPLMMFVSALISVSFIDIHVQLIPDRITLPLIVAGLVGSGAQSLFSGYHFWPLYFVQSFLGFVTGLFLLLFIIIGYGLVTGVEGMGMGDVKLLALIGTYLGWEKAILTLILACFIGSLLAIPLFLFKGKSRTDKISFGPFLSMSALFCLFYGDVLIHFYMSVMSLNDY